MTTLQGNYSVSTELQSQIENTHLYAGLSYALLHINAYILLGCLVTDLGRYKEVEQQHKYVFDALNKVAEKNAELLFYLDHIQEYMHSMRNLELV